MIELKDVTKAYGDGNYALNKINLTFDEGKINVLIGPSGCGKTTTLRTLNRLVNHTSGQIYFNEKDITTINPVELRRSIGYVVQSISLFPHMSIYNNIAIVPRLLKWDKSRIDEKVNELLNLVALDPEIYKNRMPSELSGGQQQRVGVVRALAGEPSTVLMDEPFSSLDPISREQLQDELIRLQNEINKTFVFVTHDIDEAIKIANKIILMKDGEIVQTGTPMDLLKSPENKFVEEFIGPERLKKAANAPEVKELVVDSYKIIKDDQSTSEAINIMLSEEKESLTVINEDEKYLGTISLYKALQYKDQPLNKIIENNDPVYDSDNIEKVLAYAKKYNIYDVPVVNKENEWMGVITKESMYEVLGHSYSNESEALL